LIRQKYKKKFYFIKDQFDKKEFFLEIVKHFYQHFLLVKGAYPRVEHLKYTSIWYALALLAKNRLGWMGLSGKNYIFLGSFVSYKENKVKSIWPLECLSIARLYS